jgi:hypothetical protein
MEFIEFRDKLKQHIDEILLGVDYLFFVNLDKGALYNLYLDSFPGDSNTLFRKRRTYDCSVCRSFIKSFGNIVTIKDQKVTSIWDFECGDETYQAVLNALSAFVHSHPVADVFVTNIGNFGLEHNVEKSSSTELLLLTWYHLYYILPNRFVTKSKYSVESIRGEYRDTRNVFKRSLDEISKDAVITVLELTAQNSLYRGVEHQKILETFLEYKNEYEKLSTSEKENYTWEKCVTVGDTIGRIRNHAIGTLLTDISNEVELDEAVRKYEAVMAPTNYKRPKAIYTKKMIEGAQKEIEELGFIDSLERRFATLEDITVNNILFSNKDASRRILGSVFEKMKEEISVNPKSFTRVEEIPIETFIKDVLPSVTNIELLLEGRHTGNMVSLVAPKNKDSKTMFKWGNNFSWSYAGNVTDSMKERVKAAGGKVDGVLRFSIQWNDGEEHNPNDFDAHCVECRRNEIYFAWKYNSRTRGTLDVDIMRPEIGKAAVENITWPTQEYMWEGYYDFFVHCFMNRGGRGGFSAEIEFDGEIHSFSHDKELRQDEIVKVAIVNYTKSQGFKITKSMESINGTISSRDIWNVKTNQFHPVTVIMHSPNYWDFKEGIGNKHYFFMLKNCLNPEKPNGFFNEYLDNNLMIHKKVFEALGGMMRVEDSENQLSGVGFSSTQRNSVICKLDGHVLRTVKIIF